MSRVTIISLILALMLAPQVLISLDGDASPQARIVFSVCLVLFIISAAVSALRELPHDTCEDEFQDHSQR